MVEIRGEVFMKFDDFARLNSQAQLKGVLFSPIPVMLPRGLCAEGSPVTLQAQFLRMAWGPWDGMQGICEFGTQSQAYSLYMIWGILHCAAPAKP